MARVVLQEQQRELLREERKIASELQAFLFGFEGADAYASTLRQVTEALDEMFLLVVVGEFNAGKSSCINALLHEQVLEEGVVPTTSQITIMRYGEERAASARTRSARTALPCQFPARHQHRRYARYKRHPARTGATHRRVHPA